MSGIRRLWIVRLRAGLPWLLLAGVSFFLAWTLDRYLTFARPYVRFRNGGSFLLAHENLHLLYCIPPVLLIAGGLTVRIRLLRQSWPVLIASLLQSGIHLLFAYAILWTFPPRLGEPLPTGLAPELRELIEHADRVVLFSISPNPSAPHSPANQDEFHGFSVLGKVDLKEAAARSNVVGALLTSIDENFGVSMMCFEPRHAMRFEQGTNHMDMLICYECYKLVISRGDKSEYVCLSQSSKSTLNRVLRKAGVPLASEH